MERRVTARTLNGGNRHTAGQSSVIDNFPEIDRLSGRSHANFLLAMEAAGTETGAISSVG